MVFFRGGEEEVLSAYFGINFIVDVLAQCTHVIMISDKYMEGEGEEQSTEGPGRRRGTEGN